MNKTGLTEIMRIQVEIALASSRQSLSDLASLEAAAQQYGLSGAEIDAAKRGRSFDAAIDVALAYALALLSEDKTAIDMRERRLARLGLSSVASGIEKLVAVHVDRPPTK